MRIEKTITQLQVNPGSQERAKELGQLGYMQWLGGLPGGASYHAEAVQAYQTARPFKATDPAVAVFCDLLQASLNGPAQPLGLALPQPCRRGGARRRRLSV